MKGVRILQLIAVILVALYLLAFANINPDPLTLPLLPMVIPLPPVLVVVIALVGGWLVGWLPTTVALWRQRRETRRLRRRLEEHEPAPAAVAPMAEGRPVIPDRPPPADDEGTEPS